MSRKKPLGFGKMLRRVVAGLLGKRPGTTASHHALRHLRFEPLEGRAMLANDLAAITGIVSLGGTPVAGATINLYQDDGDALFEPGAGDTQVGTTTSAAVTGSYRFDRVQAGNYWVQQPAQTLGAIDLGAAVSGLINISALEAEGILDDTLDDFNDAAPQTVQAANVVGTIDADATDYVDAVGFERDLIVELTSGGAGEFVQLDSQLGRLLITSTTNAQGEFTVVYDGDDDDGDTLNPIGLGGIDVTNSGVNTAIKVRIRADQAGANLRIRAFTDATHFSDSQPLPFPIPGTNVDTDAIFYFSDFQAGTGAAGVADATDIGALEMSVQTTTDATNGRVTLLGVFRPTLETQNFVNEADLSLTKIVNDDTPNVGQNVTFTLTVTNAGAAGATDVVVRDLLPLGMTFVSSVPGQGTYNELTGDWNVGDIAAAANATLTITATVATPGVKINTAEITAVDQTDPDSTPNNNVPAEDDQDSVTLTPTSSNLSLAKIVDVSTPNVGQNVVFTLTLSNAGPDTATGIVVEDVLPAGLTFVSSTPSQGTYVSGTGVWTVGSVNSGGNATLSITATVASLGAKVNTAEVVDVDQTDPNSTPDNGNVAEDDQDSVTVTPQSANLSLAKIVNDATPSIGQNVIFTLTVANAGPNTATGVVVEDLLPAGLTFVSATPSQGAYVSGTGVWTVGSINSGANATLAITATNTTLAVKNNTAEVTDADQADPNSTPDNGNASEDDQDTVTVTPDAADLSIVKIVDDATPTLGTNVTFSITVTNTGPSAATGVVIEDLLPAGLTFVGGLPSQGTYVAGTGIWTVGTLNSGANAVLGITATAATTGAKTNTAEVTASGQGDPDSTPDNGIASEDDQSSVTVTPWQIDLAVTKVVDNPAQTVGQNVIFTVTVSNVGGIAAATGVVVDDLLPAGLTFVSATPSQGTYSQATGDWTVGTVGIGANATLSITATVATPGAKTNTAQVIAADQADQDSTPNNNAPAEDDQASATVTPPGSDLSLTKIVNDSTPVSGQNITFTLTLTNGGPTNATGVVVEDLLPAGLTFVSSTPSQGTYVSGTGLWTVGAVNSGANATLDIVATVATSGAKINTAEVFDSDQTDPDSTPDNGIASEDDQASVTVTPEIADLSVTKIVDDNTPDRSQNVVFTITVANGGPQAATGVQVTDLLPAGLTFVSSTPSQGSYVAGTGIWTVGTVNSGATATLAITATAATSGAKVNTAELTDVDQFDSDSTPGNAVGTEDDQASATVTPNVADLSLTKIVNDNTPNRNQNITFTLTLTNGGPAGATGVTVSDQLPAGLTFVSATPSVGTYSSSTGIWTVGSLASGANATLAITATTNAIGQKINTAEVAASGQFDSDSTPANNQAAEDDQASVTVTPTVADLSVVKTVNQPTTQVGQNAVFTVTVANAGPDAATGVQVTDLLPAGLTFVSATPSQGTYSSTTGIWNVGTVNSGANATLQITATVASPTSVANSAQLTAADQFDADSTPGNNQSTEDDQSTTSITASGRFSKRLFLSRPLP